MRLALAVVALALAGCNALGGIPDATMDAIASAGGGCVKVTGVWGQGIVIVGNVDKGVIRNGEVTVSGDCAGMTIRDAATVRSVPPVSGTVTTTTVPPQPGTVTTTVQPPK